MHDTAGGDHFRRCVALGGRSGLGDVGTTLSLLSLEQFQSTVHQGECAEINNLKFHVRRASSGTVYSG